jgi:hypothetical protein
MTMMTNKRFVLLTIFVGVIATLVGCELVVDFDRSKIPVESVEGGELDVANPSLDAETPETSTGSDATVAETGADSGTDSGTDTGTDASDDGSDDAPDGEF